MSKNPDPNVMPVMHKRCSECLFSSKKVVGEDRKAEVLGHCVMTGRAFECHKATIAGVYAVCRGFFDVDGAMVVTLAKALGAFKFVELTGDEDAPVRHVDRQSDQDLLSSRRGVRRDRTRGKHSNLRRGDRERSRADSSPGVPDEPSRGVRGTGTSRGTDVGEPGKVR